MLWLQPCRMLYLVQDPLQVGQLVLWVILSTGWEKVSIDPSEGMEMESWIMGMELWIGHRLPEVEPRQPVILLDFLVGRVQGKQL